MCRERERERERKKKDTTQKTLVRKNHFASTLNHFIFVLVRRQEGILEQEKEKKKDKAALVAIDYRF